MDALTSRARNVHIIKQGCINTEKLHFTCIYSEYELKLSSQKHPECQGEYDTPKTH